MVRTQEAPSGTGSGSQKKEVAAQLSGRGNGGSVVRNRKWRPTRKVLGVLSEAVEMDQLQWRRGVIGFCAVGKWA